MGFGAGKTLKNMLYSIPVALMTLLPSCEPNQPPTAKLDVNPISGDIPLEVRMRVTGQDPDGVGDILWYNLYIGSENIRSNTPINITRTFQNIGKVDVYGEVTDSHNHINKTNASSIQVAQGPYIDQSAVLARDSEIDYSATIYKIAGAEFKMNKDGVLFLTQNLNSNFQKTFKYNPDLITKGIYEFTLKSGNLEKKNSVEIPNYKPSMNLTGINGDLMEDSEKTITLPSPSDKNPEDLPVSINSARSLDGKTLPTLNGTNLKIKAIGNKIGLYQIEFEFGSAVGGLEKAVLQGNIIDDPRWKINFFVQPNDSTLNWYGSGDVNKDNTVNAQDLTRLNELIAGTYSDPTDKRLNDRADVNGDGIVNNADKQILEDKLNGVIQYTPGEWNKLLTKAERESWLSKMLSIDKTNELQYIPGGWICGDFARQIVINFHGFGELGYDESLGLKDNGRFNIPVEYVSIGAPGFGHAINYTATGNNIENFQDGTYTEPQTDWIVYPGMYNGFPANCQVAIKAPFNKNRLHLIEILKFKIENTIPSLIWVNPDTNLNIIKQR
jgi:hypothetical protein